MNPVLILILLLLLTSIANSEICTVMVTNNG